MRESDTYVGWVRWNLGLHRAIYRARSHRLVNTKNNCVIIAHDRVAQKHMDELRTPWSVQYEIARGVGLGLWAWDDVTEATLQELRGQGWNAYSTRRVGDVFGDSLGQQKLEIWYTSFVVPSRANLTAFRVELEREQKAIVEDATRGLGLMGEWMGVTDWYGGRIQQIACLVKTSDNYALQLGAMQKVGRSHRLGRLLGSRRILQVKIPKDVLYDQQETDQLKDFLSHEFVLCGRVFEVFSVKDGKVYLVETDSSYDRTPMDSEGDQHRKSLRSLVDWYNPLELNGNQVGAPPCSVPSTYQPQCPVPAP